MQKKIKLFVRFVKRLKPQTALKKHANKLFALILGYKVYSGSTKLIESAVDITVYLLITLALISAIYAIFLAIKHYKK